MGARSVIPVLQAAYRLDLDAPAWIDGVVQAVAPRLDRGLGLCVIVYDASDPKRLQVEPPRYHGCPEEVRGFVLRAIQALPADVARDSLVSPAACVSSEVLGPRRLAAWFGSVGSAGIADTVVLNAIDPTLRGCLVAAPLPRIGRLAPRSRALLERLTAHVASGHRLRRTLGTLTSPELDRAEAIVDTRGRVVHAAGEAQADAAQAMLRRAARHIDRAQLRGTAPDEQLDLWRGLVEGRWSLLDQFDSDGRRFFVAYRNDPVVQAQRRLTRREAQVVGYAALGQANKLIGYALGLSASTVATHLTDAQSKLGVKSRTDLIAAMGALGGS